MEAHDITFHEITMEDKRWMDEKFAEEGKNACEYTFANNFIWRKRYGVAVAEICGCLIVRSLGDDSFVYSYPRYCSRNTARQRAQWYLPTAARMQMR